MDRHSMNTLILKGTFWSHISFKEVGLYVAWIQGVGEKFGVTMQYS